VILTELCPSLELASLRPTPAPRSAVACAVQTEGSNLGRRGWTDRDRAVGWEEGQRQGQGKGGPKRDPTGGGDPTGAG